MFLILLLLDVSGLDQRVCCSVVHLVRCIVLCERRPLVPARLERAERQKLRVGLHAGADAVTHSVVTSALCASLCASAFEPAAPTVPPRHQSHATIHALTATGLCARSPPSPSVPLPSPPSLCPSPDGLRSLCRGQGHRLRLWPAARHPRAAHARAGATGSSAGSGRSQRAGRSGQQRRGGGHGGVAASTRGARIHDATQSGATAHGRTASTVHAHRHSSGGSRGAAEGNAQRSKKEWRKHNNSSSGGRSDNAERFVSAATGRRRRSSRRCQLHCSSRGCVAPQRS